MKQNKCVKAVVFKIDYNDYIITEESFSINFLVTTGYLISDAMLAFIIYMLSHIPSHEIFKLSFKEEVNLIKEQYKSLEYDKEEIKNKLKIKKDNYDRLTR